LDKKGEWGEKEMSYGFAFQLFSIRLFSIQLFFCLAINMPLFGAKLSEAYNFLSINWRFLINDFQLVILFGDLSVSCTKD